MGEMELWHGRGEIIMLPRAVAADLMAEHDIHTCLEVQPLPVFFDIYENSLALEPQRLAEDRVLVVCHHSLPQ